MKGAFVGFVTFCMYSHARAMQSNYHSSMEIKLIIDFISFKQLKSVFLTACYDNKTYVKSLTQDLNKMDTYVSLLNNKSSEKSLSKLGDRHVGIVVGGGCTQSVNIMRNASSLNRFTLKQHWLVINLSADSVIWDSLNINVDSDILIARPVDYGFELTDVYSRGYMLDGGALQRNHAGSWVLGSGFIWTNTMSFATYDRRSNLSGLILRSAVVTVYPFKHETLLEYVQDLQATPDLMTKINFNSVVMLLSEMFNFQLRLSRVTAWGILDSHSMASGQLGLLQRREVDLGGTSMYIKPERLKFMDYIGETFHQRSIILFRQPKSTGWLPRVFLKPLAWNVWVLAAITFTLVVVSLFISSYWLTKWGKNRQKYVLPERYTETSLSEIIVAVLGVMCQQGNFITMELASMRISLLTMLTFSLLIYQFYSASIVSLRLSVSPKKIKTPEDLLHSDLKLIIEDIVYHRTFLEASQSKIVKELYEKKAFNGTVPAIFMSSVEGVELARRGGYAFYGEYDNIYTAMAKTYSMSDICNIDKIYIVKHTSMVTPVQKHSPYRKMFAVGFRKALERGLVTKEQNSRHAKRPPCLQAISANTFSVGLPETAAAFTLLATAMMFAFMILTVELACSYRAERMGN